MNKLDLAQGLPQQARRCGVRVKALLVVGPLGVLWTYHVATLVEEGARIRVNSLVMPHARITGKSTGLVSSSDAASMVEAIQRAPLVRAGIPPRHPGDDGDDGDFAYRLLLVTFERGKAEYFHANFNEFRPDAGGEVLLERVNVLLAATTTRTYRHGAQGER